ncbi:hypothetical protein FQA39_LY04193 [Lamprigera yunnana]|nr:hypothetical protein FQA39_LY04193 [Lamprigera yunnana]
MDKRVEIKDLDKLLRKFLGDDVKVLNISLNSLTQKSENYGSVIYELVILMQNKKNNAETLNLVAKVSPPSEYLKRVFPVEICFKNEINMYKHVLPTLNKFCANQKDDDAMDFFPKCYAARSSLTDDEMYDENVVLILENLNSVGYELVNRTESFDLATTFVVIKNLAKFHAASLSLKLLKPKEFEENILNIIAKKVKFNTVSKESQNKMIQLAVQASYRDKILIQKATENLENYFRMYARNPTHREPFATLIHNDFWIPNLMIKFENGRPMKNMILDFQRIEYGCPARDLIFFLFTSVKLDLLDQNYGDFIKYYFREFSEDLQQLKCDIAPFTFNEFIEEIRNSACTKELFHLIFMTQYVHAESNKKQILGSNHRSFGDRKKIGLIGIVSYMVMTSYVLRIRILENGITTFDWDF